MYAIERWCLYLFGFEAVDEMWSTFIVLKHEVEIGDWIKSLLNKQPPEKHY